MLPRSACTPRLPEAISLTVLQERDRIKVERAKAASEGRTTTFEVTVPSSMDEIERAAIEATLDYTKGDKTHAARALGIGRKTLYRKLEQYNGKTNPQITPISQIMSRNDSNE